MVAPAAAVGVKIAVEDLDDPLSSLTGSWF
jgi:hypothetical protein